MTNDCSLFQFQQLPGSQVLEELEGTNMKQQVHHFARAAVTTYYKLDGLKINSDLFPSSGT